MHRDVAAPYTMTAYLVELVDPLPTINLDVPMGSPATADRPDYSPCGEETAAADSSKGVKHLVETHRALQTLPRQYVLPEIARPLLLFEAPIPVVDAGELRGGRRELVVKEIAAACQEWGFFRIVNHGVQERSRAEMMRTVEAFFDLPWEEKSKYSSDDVMSPVRYGTSMNTSKPHLLHWRDFLRHYGRPFPSTSHPLPDMPPEYRRVAKEYMEEIWRLATLMLGAISEGLGLERDYIENSLGEGSQILAANYYPPCPQPELTLGLSPHSDHGALTILMENDVAGLQVKHDDKWVPVPHVPGSYLANIGDYSEILSNGRYMSVEHRAVVNDNKTRISIATGHGPAHERLIGPAVPLLERDGKPRYRTVRYADYVRNQQSSVIRGKLALQALRIHE